MRWMWIDRVVQLVPRSRLVAVKTVSLSEEHLHDHFPAHDGLPPLPVMPASLILEGAAQSAGILVGHAEHFAHKVILAKVSRAEFTREATPGCTLRYTATLTQIDRAGASACVLVELIRPTTSPPAAEPLGQVELMFSHLDQNMAGLEFPSHNFVFGENLRAILHASGITRDD